MSELKLVSPLLDQMSVEEEIAGHNGCTCYALRHVQSGERFVVKRISVPASDLQVRALILSGAYPDDAAVHAYYGSVAEDIKNELDTGMRLAENGYFAGASSYQIEPKESGIGYDVYILYPRMVSLRAFLDHSAMTGLRAVNLGIDLCDALTACRDAGYLFENLKPENVFLTQSGRFLLGDLGLAPLEDLQYASVPENYLGPYSAPELSAITASPNPTIDLYAVGMLLYRIYNGNHGPFEDEATGEAMADKLRLTGKAMRGNTVTYGEFGLVALEPSWITSNQIEAARIAMTRYTKRGGKVWIKIFPDKPITEKPAETRMGSGKGSPEYWVAVVKPGRVMFEIAGVSEEVAREALRLASHKLPIKSKIVKREDLEAQEVGE